MNTFREINVSVASATAQADALRAAMVDEMRERGDIRTDELAAAFHAVPRHVFAPGEPLEAAYRSDDVVITKRDGHGIAISSVSAPPIQAMMLDQAELRRGIRVLEIGSGGLQRGADRGVGRRGG